MRKKLSEKEKKQRAEELKNESTATKFKRVATPRLRKALKDIKLLGNCSTKDYAYTKDQTETILGSLTAAVITLEKQFSGTAAEATAIQL